MSGAPRAAVLARVLLLLAGLVALGRLASRAWLEGPDLDVPAPPSAPRSDGALASTPTPFLLCVIDGLREEATAGGDDPVMPFWRELAAEGASGVAITGEPTLTAACVRTLLTGRNPDLAAAARNFDARVVRENLIERLAEAGARVGHAGDASAHQLARPWYRDADVFAVADQGPGDQGLTDDRAMPFALARVGDGVDALTVHLTRPDHAGHVHGAGLEAPEGGGRSPYAAACRRVDEQLRALVAAFRARHAGALVVVAADHGVTPRGTHGGGEAAARRAPFVAVGPLVVPHAGVELSQAALASTMAVWLDVAPLAFAESPPALEWTKLTPPARRAALEAYVNVRLAVAARTGAKDLADAIAIRRARLAAEGTDAALARLAAEARSLDERMATAHDPWRVAGALALACLLWLLCADDRGARSPRLGLLAAAGAVLASLRLESSVLAAGAVATAGCITLTTRAGPLPARAAALTLAAFVGLAALSFAIKPVVETPSAFASASVGLASAAALLAGFAGWALQSRPARTRLIERVRASPAALLLLLGLLVGFPTSLRPFVDPVVDLSHVYAVLAIGVGWLVVRSRRAVEAAPLARFGAIAAAAVAFLAPRLEGFRSPAVTAIVGCAFVAAAGAFLRGVRACGRSVLGAVSALVSLSIAVVVRGPSLPGALPYGAIAAASFLAFGLSARDRGDLALATRLTAALALAFLLERSGDDAALRFAVLALGAYAAGRVPAPSTPAGAVGFAAMIALLRIAMFHALGSTETLSTVDTGAGVVPGIGTTTGVEAGLTPAVLANLGVQAIRFSLPWIVLLAMAARMCERGPARSAVTSPRLVADLVALLAVRGIALVVALAIWWPSSWWVSTARAVYVFAAGDVLLALGSAALVGVFARSSDGAGVRPGAAPAGS